MEQKQVARPVVELVVKWIIFTAAITGMAVVAALYPLQGNIPIIVIPAIIAIVFWKPVFFEKMKLTTLVVMRIIIIFAALRFFNPQIYVNIILVMLIVNILEATLTDLLKHKRYWNAVSGFAIAIGVFVLRGAWVYDAVIGDFYIAYGITPLITILYMVAYTIWNWIFVTDEFSPSVSLMHVGFLLSPIIGCICCWGLGLKDGFGMWLILRANSLSIGGWLQIGAKSWFEKEYYSPKMEKFITVLHTKKWQILFMLVNLLLIVAAIVLTIQNGGFNFDWVFTPMK